MENPFKFGTIVEEEYFTDRVQEVAYIEQFIQSANHLVLISPRRFGKSSVVAKAVKQSGRKNITVNLQLRMRIQGRFFRRDLKRSLKDSASSSIVVRAL